MMRVIVTFLICLFISLPKPSCAQKFGDWDRPYAPFRIAGNVYYVGTYDLACFLVTTPNGHILVNTAIESTVDQLKKNVEQLGFKFSDIKILLVSQGHVDHTGGLAEIKRLTGATVMIDEKDAQVVEDGGHSDFIYGEVGGPYYFPGVKVDRVLKDHDVVELGGTKLEMLHHPGHTKGSCSYLLMTKDESRSWTMLIANMPFLLPEVKPGMATYPDIMEDAKKTIRAMRNIDFDIWVAAHASQFNLHKLRKEGDTYNPAVFGDRKEYIRQLDNMQSVYKERKKSK
ncbi:MAG: subclass B3 metallo-beta-lactamase [Taibaiella sp.]|nr:subclass B3 metallo-beta-lactamase [Taibaiella sp.]